MLKTTKEKIEEATSKSMLAQTTLIESMEALDMPADGSSSSGSADSAATASFLQVSSSNKQQLSAGQKLENLANKRIIDPQADKLKKEYSKLEKQMDELLGSYKKTQDSLKAKIERHM